MRILAFSDLHRDIAAAGRIVSASVDADILVGAGDFATNGVGASDTIDILKAVDLLTIIVPGNHDNWDDLKNLCASWPAARLLHGTACVIGKTTFFGLGAEIPGRNNQPWKFSVGEQDASRMLLRCPAGAVLFTHTPPHGCADLQRDGTLQGSTAIRAAIEKTRPILSLCGHIHFSWGASGRIGATPVHNLGPTANWFEV